MNKTWPDVFMYLIKELVDLIAIVIALALLALWIFGFVLAVGNSKIWCVIPIYSFYVVIEHFYKLWGA